LRMMGPFMCSPLGVSRGAEDVEPTIDDEPVDFQVKRFVWNSRCPFYPQEQTSSGHPGMSERCHKRDLGCGQK
jgi:hypothetical protein